MYRRILVPTDGSDGSMAAAEHAIELATTFDADLHTLYVIQTNLGPDAGVVGASDAFEAAGQRAIETVVERAEAAGLDEVESSLVQGSPQEAILDYADGHDIDLIVMGTHGRTGLDRYLIGSVTEKVVRFADVPVLTVGMADASD